MAELENTVDNAPRESGSLSDSELLPLFQQQTELAWRIFLDRYADYIFSLLRSLGFDYDQAMDRFVYVCEKLSEKNCHRLKSVRYAGSYGELKPWLRQVVNRLCINWAWSEDGRKRLLKPIQKMGKREQRIFELFFWQGLSPVAIEERLQLEHFENVTLAAVFEALEQIHQKLSEKKLWRLISNLVRTQRTIALEDIDGEICAGLEPIDAAPNPEESLVQKEQARKVGSALAALSTQEALMLQFRYDDGASDEQIAAILKLPAPDVRKSLKAALAKLRNKLA